MKQLPEKKELSLQYCRVKNVAKSKKESMIDMIFYVPIKSNHRDETNRGTKR